ncbi:MAG: hypothetical protein LC660_16520, partial [Desulfobacteraceae bacterium]|nr:hypothetical protein [Desulfobacteraceae bacterium]
MDNFMDLHLKPHVLSSLGLPDMHYPVITDDMNSTLAADGELPLATLFSCIASILPQGSPPGQGPAQTVNLPAGPKFPDPVNGADLIETFLDLLGSNG